MKPDFKGKKGFLMYIGLLLAVAIIFMLFFYLFNTFYKSPSVDEPTQKTLSTHGIDSTSYQSVVDSAREKVKDLEKQLSEREQQIYNSQ